jgi:hypothetical protein
MNRTMDALEGGLDVPTWRSRFEDLMEQYHAEALRAGLGRQEIGAEGAQYLQRVMDAQVPYLNRWALQIQEDPTFDRGWRMRAALYAMAVKQDFWTGRTRFLPLPAMPGDGTTQCLGNCNCHWQIEWIDEAAGDADAYWIMTAGEHCQTCAVRAAEWAPYRIRQGFVVEV